MAFILLISKDDYNSRRYKTYENSQDMGEALVSLYEGWLDEEEQRKTGKPVSPVDGCHEYTTDDLYKFLKETMCEVICLVRQEGSFSESLYIPYTIDWIAESCIFAYFAQQQ